MTDKELADRVVALGVAQIDDMGAGIYFLPRIIWPPRSAENFVRDWRVAGALMERCGGFGVGGAGDDGYYAVVVGEQGSNESVTEDESLPRAIISACVEALEPK